LLSGVLSRIAGRQKRASGRSLKTHLLLFGLALLIPIVTFAAITISEFTAGVRASSEQRAMSVASAIASNIDRDLTSKITLLEALALSPSLASRDLAAFYQQAHDAVTNTGAHVLLTDATGQEIFHTRLPFGTPLPASRDLDGIRRVVETRQPHVSDLFHGPIFRRPVYNVKIPVLEDGAVRYVLIMAPEVEALTRIVQQQVLPEGWFGLVVDRNDVIIARSQSTQRPVGTKISAAVAAGTDGNQGIVFATGLSGQPSLFAYVRSQVSGWRVAVRVPLEVMDAPLRRSWLSLLGVGSAALLFALALAYVFGKRLAKAIEAATEVAKRIKGGEAAEPITTSLREANDVIEVLHQTSVGLNERTKALQESERRTRDQNEHLEFTMRELLHRSKNLLAIIQAMARQSSRGAQNFEDFQSAFASRLRAISHSHDLLVARNWHGAAIEDLVQMQLAPFLPDGSQSVSVAGPHIVLTPKAAENIGLALHELATNSAKYGALSVPQGKVAIEWVIKSNGSGGSEFCISWREHGGPPVTCPEKQGFGHKVLMGVAPSALNAKVDLEFPAEGVVWTLSVRAGDLVSTVDA
jgi:two-component sensor histidine kinase